MGGCFSKGGVIINVRPTECQLSEEDGDNIEAIDEQKLERISIKNKSSTISAANNSKHSVATNSDSVKNSYLRKRSSLNNTKSFSKVSQPDYKPPKHDCSQKRHSEPAVRAGRTQTGSYRPRPNKITQASSDTTPKQKQNNSFTRGMRSSETRYVHSSEFPYTKPKLIHPSARSSRLCGHTGGIISYSFKSRQSDILNVENDHQSYQSSSQHLERTSINNMDQPSRYQSYQQPSRNLERTTIGQNDIQQRDAARYKNYNFSNPVNSIILQSELNMHWNRNLQNE